METIAVQSPHAVTSRIRRASTSTKVGMTFAAELGTTPWCGTLIDTRTPNAFVALTGYDRRPSENPM